MCTYAAVLTGMHAWSGQPAADDLPQLRMRRSGVVVNITSRVTLAPIPLAGP
jgi:hypothetical protein